MIFDLCYFRMDGWAVSFFSGVLVVTELLGVAKIVPRLYVSCVYPRWVVGTAVLVARRRADRRRRRERTPDG